MNHPYERLGIIASVVILVAVLSVGIVMMHAPYEYDKGSSHNCSLQGEENLGDQCLGADVNHWNVPSVLKPVQEPKYPMSYYYENQAKQQCKILANDLQEFYDCVNNP